MKIHSSVTLALAALLAGLGSLPAATTLSFQSVPPTPGTNDIYNYSGATQDGQNVSDGAAYANGAANDAFTYIAMDRANQGQTFTTGNSTTGYEVRAVWFRHCGYTNNTDLTWYRMDAGSSLTVRVTDPAQAGTDGFPLASESYTITGTEPGKIPAGAYYNSANGTGTWLRFGLDVPVHLSANTVYGFDVAITGGLCFFETYGSTNDSYAGGGAYNGSTVGVPDTTLNPLVGDRVFLVEMVAPAVPPTIVTQPKNQLIIEGDVARLTVVANGTQPLVYQWYQNDTTELTGQTSDGITVLGANRFNVTNTYSVVITNDGGSVTSSVAKVAVILPSVSTNISFGKAGSGILDANGVALPFGSRLPDSGTSLTSPDTNLAMDTNAGTLTITSTTCDFNGQTLMDMAEALGIQMSSVGFTGSEDFSIVGSFTNLPISTYIDYDQVGIFVGGHTTNFVRGGLIYVSPLGAAPGSYGVCTPGTFDAGIITAAVPPDAMVVTINRSRGSCSVLVNGLVVTPGADMSFLNNWTDLTAGVFALDTSGTHNTTTVENFKVNLFTGPKVNVAVTGSDLTFTWNVAGAGLESNTDLNNANGWTAVPGAASSPYVIAIPATGSKYYRVAQ